MRELTSRGVVIAARGSNLARLYFTQRFGDDFDKVLISELRPENGIVRVINTLYKILWAMNKAENYYLKKSTPDYDQWREKTINSGFDIGECMDDLMAEITEGFTVSRTYGKSNDSDGGRNLPQKIMAVALKMGMSMDEINEMTTQTLIDIMHEYVDSGKKEERRMATPEETAAYFGGVINAGNKNRPKKL